MGNGNSFFFRILLRRVEVVEKRFAVVRATTRRDAAHVINRVGASYYSKICRHSQTPHRTRP